MGAEVEPAERSSRLGWFYEDALSDGEMRLLERAFEVDGIDQEIAVLRVRFHSVVKEYERFRDLIAGLEMLAKAVAVKYGLGPGSQEQLQEALRAVLDRMNEMEGGGDDGH